MSLTRQCLQTAVLSQVAMLHCILKHQRICWKDLKILKRSQPQIKKNVSAFSKTTYIEVSVHNDVKIGGAGIFFFFFNTSGPCFYSGGYCMSLF